MTRPPSLRGKNASEEDVSEEHASIFDATEEDTTKEDHTPPAEGCVRDGEDASSFDETEENVSSSDASSSDAFLFVALDVLLQNEDALEEDTSSFIASRRCD